MNEGIYEITDEVIGNKAYLSSKDIREVIIGEDIRHIGDWAFAKCSNLCRVSFAGDFCPGLFGRDVFGGCTRLGSISFRDTDQETTYLLAACVNRMYYDHLLRADDVGQKSWYEKWDICLVSELSDDGAAARNAAALCGEEDISYDGIGSVDGEMPGETKDYVKNEEFRKCSLCYLRLDNDRNLSEGTRDVIKAYLTSNSFGEGFGAAFYSLFEDENTTLKFMRIYLDTGKHDRETLKRLINEVPIRDVGARAFLIRETDGGVDPLFGLML